MRRTPLHRGLALLLLLVPFVPVALRAQGGDTAHRAALEKDAVELGTYTLTMDTVSRLFQATHDATEAAKVDPSMKVSFEGDPDANSPTIDQLANKLSTSPKLVALLAEHGFTPREYSAATMSLIQTGMAMMAMQSGQTLDQVVRAAHVNPANIKLLADHRADIEALRTKYPTQ